MATRRERVILELQDDFTSGMARAAASAALLNRELNSLSRDSVRTQRSFSDIDRSSQTFGRNSERTGSQIDRLSGRLRVLTEVATILAPAFVPIGGVAIPAISGLASQLGFAAVAGGTAILAFQGIGDTLKALDKAALDPTRENLEAANLAMAKLSPAARKFATEVRALIPEAQRLRNIAAEGLFPGVVEGLESLEAVLPRVEQIVASVSTELGEIAADTGASLASDRWAPFLDFIAAEAPSALGDMVNAAGNVAHAMAELWMAFDPLNDDFSKWLVDATQSLDEWAAGLSQTEGFNDFVAYIEEHGPQVADTFGAIGNAVLQTVEATAPLGGPVLAGIEALANALGAIAGSDIGTPLFTAAAALALFNRTMAVTVAGRNGLAGFGARLTGAGAQTKVFSANLRTTRADLALLGTTALTAGARTQRELARTNAAAVRLRTNLAPIGKGAGLFAGLAVAATGAADGVGLTNTASLALMGSLAGAPGVLAGGLIGGLIDARSASSGFAGAMDDANRALASTDVTKLERALAAVKKARDDQSNVTGFGDFFGDVATQALDVRSTLLGPFADSSADKAKEKVDEVKEALDMQREVDRAKADLDFLALGFDATSAGLDSATQSAEDFKTSLDKINQVLTGRATFRDYQQALDDFADRAAKRAETRAKILEAESGVAQAQADLASAKTPTETESAQNRLKAAKENVAALREELTKYKNTLDVTTEAGRDTQASIDAIATSAIGYAKTIQDPALRTAFLDNARDQYLKATIEAGASAEAAQQLATDIGLLNGVKGKVHIIVTADGVEIISELERRLRRLSRLVNLANVEPRRGRREDDLFASGGWTGPGAKYQPAGIVHADEFVFSKEATRGNVAYLDALHRQLRGYADGGLVRRYSPPPVSVSVSGGGGPQIDYDRLAAAMSAVRPMYGDVKISGDPTVFRRQMQDDRRASASDGVRR